MNLLRGKPVEQIWLTDNVDIQLSVYGYTLRLGDDALQTSSASSQIQQTDGFSSINRPHNHRGVNAGYYGENNGIVYVKMAR